MTALTTSTAAQQIKVIGLPPVWGAPNPSPFAIKLMTWLRMAKIPYEAVILRRLPQSSSGKVPYIVHPDGRLISDSSTIIELLAAERGIDLDTHLDARARAEAHVIRCTLEEHLYFVGLYERFGTDAGYARTSVDYFKHAPWPLRSLAPIMVRRNALKNLHGQGTGRLSREQILARGRADIVAVSTLLGDRPFVMGEQPSTVDASLVGFVWAMSSNPFDSVVRDTIRAHPNLTSYLERARARWWSDWTPPADG